MDGVKTERSTFWFPMLGWCLAFVILVSIVLMQKGTPSTLTQANDLKATQAPSESFRNSDRVQQIAIEKTVNITTCSPLPPSAARASLHAASHSDADVPSR